MLIITILLILVIFADGIRQGLHAMREKDLDARRWAIMKIGIAFLATGFLLLQNVDAITAAYVSWHTSTNIQEEEPVSIRDDSLIS